ncbi:MAG: YHS domain-containing (seleno)protein [Burkholderiaceae bacterium]
MNFPTLTVHPRILRRIATLIAVGAVACLMGCAAINAQNPSGSLKPVNAHVVDGISPVMLKGHDVVAYFTQGKHALGTAQFNSLYEGVNFHFASAEHKALFDKEPIKYIPQFGGYCANGVVYGIPWGGDADTWMIREGKLYIFGGQGSKDGFEVDVPGNMALANKYWSEEVAGSNSFIQRTKRLVFKVPHYKSGEQIAKDVAAKKAKG